LNKRFFLACIFSFVTLASCSSREATTSSGAPQTAAPSTSSSLENVEQTLIQLEHDWANAMVQRDVARLDQILANDFITTLPDGQTNSKADHLDEIRTEQYKVESMTLDNIKVRVFGDTAVVTYGVTEKSVDKGKDSGGHSVWTDVFVKRNGSWQIVAEHGSAQTAAE
jgi:ketosteroid isomerase-like protein